MQFYHCLTKQHLAWGPWLAISRCIEMLTFWKARPYVDNSYLVIFEGIAVGLIDDVGLRRRAQRHPLVGREELCAGTARLATILTRTASPWSVLALGGSAVRRPAYGGGHPPPCRAWPDGKAKSAATRAGSERSRPRTRQQGDRQDDRCLPRQARKRPAVSADWSKVQKNSATRRLIRNGSEIVS